MPSVQELLNNAGIVLKSYVTGRYLCTCPQCSNKRKPHNQKRQVLGVRIDGERAWWGCNHCGWTGPQVGAGNGHYQRDDRVRYEYGNNIKIRTGKQPPFVWMHLTDNGLLEKGVKDLEPDALYRLEDVEDKFVCIVEGEKDVETMWRLGIPAVCNAHGAGKWTLEHSNKLAGYDIVVFNDNDEPGYAHAKKIVECSRGLARSIKRIDLKVNWPTPPEMPQGFDITDFIERGAGDAEFIKQLIAEAPVMNGHDPGAAQPGSGANYFNWAGLADKTFPPLSHIVERFFPEGTILLAGKPKVGKSWLMLSLALAVVTGTPLLDERCEQRTVLYFALEDSERRLQARSKTILGTFRDWPTNLYGSLTLPTVDQGGIARLQQYVDEIKNIGLIIIDTLARFRGKKRKDEDQYTADYRTMSELLDFSHKNKVSIIVVHHVRKASADDPFDTISGTLGLNGGADTLALLTKANDKLRFTVRGRDVEEQDITVDFDSETAAWTVTGEFTDEKKQTDTVLKILEVLRNAKLPMSPDQISKATGLRHNTVKGTLRRMLDVGQVKQTSYGAYTL